MLNLKINIPKEEYLIVGCSSGPDSMALLHYLKNNTKNKIVCCHINHNVREQSKEEESYLKEYCSKNNIIFETQIIKNYTENNFENEARKKRYHFYEEILKKYNSKYLFLAHHGDDLIETILMKIERGSNLEGYAGIKEISYQKDYYIIRPFLQYTKEDLIKYNKNNNIKYYIDASNKEQLYKRNRYRKKILPILKKEDNNIHKKYLKYSKTLLEYLDYVNNETNKYYNKVISNNIISIPKIKKIHPFLQKQIIYKYLTILYNNKPNIIKEKHIESILNQINNMNNTTINLPLNIISKKEYDSIQITRKKEIEKKDYKIPLKEYNIINNIIIKKINDTEEDGNNICRINSNNISMPLYLRNKKNGDYIYQKGMNGKKKISDIFIDQKISKEKRDSYPILVDANDQIIWIPNIKKSKFNSQKKEFYDIILKSCKKEEEDEQ